MKYIYLHNYNNYSQRWYKTEEEEAMIACVRKNRYAMSFGIPKFVNVSNEYLVQHIKDQINLVEKAQCKMKCDRTGYDNLALDLVKKLNDIL